MSNIIAIPNAPTGIMPQYGPCLFVIVTGAIASWRALIGPTNSDKARADAPQSLRARFGTDGTQNACHGSDAPDTAAAELSFFFEQVSLPLP